MAIYFTHFHQLFHSVSLPSSLFLPYMIWLYFSPFVSLLIFFLSFHFPLSSFFSLFPPLHVVIFPSSQLSSSAFIHPSSPSLYFTFPVLCSANAPLPLYRVGIDWAFTASLGFSHSPCWMQPGAVIQQGSWERGALRLHVSSSHISLLADLLCLICSFQAAGSVLQGCSRLTPLTRPILGFTVMKMCHR